MRRITGYVTVLERVEFTNEAGEPVRRVLLHWFGHPFDGEAENGRWDLLDSKDVSCERVWNGGPLKATLIMDDRVVNARGPRLLAVEVWNHA